MALSMSHCLKRLPLASFSRCYASAASRATKPPVLDQGTTSKSAKAIKRPGKRSKKVVEEPPTPRSNEIEKHLTQLAETNGQLVLADIERCRPIKRSTPGTPVYATEFTDVLKKVTDSFNTKQLREFITLYGISPPLERSKVTYATAILEEWGWPSLASLRQVERDSEMDTETFPLTPPEAFLILGKDGTDSRSLSIQYHVRMTYLANPLSLQVEGKVGSLRKLRTHISDLKEAITEDVFELPVDKPIRTDLLHRISRLSGALTENFGQNKVRVSYVKNNPRAALVAKRLAARAVCEENESKPTQSFFHVPPSAPSPSPVSPFVHEYALYPFLTPRSLPWTVSASGVFRVRRVEDWLSAGSSEDPKKTGGLTSGRGHMVTRQQETTDLRTLLLADYSAHPSSLRTVTASIGHILLTSPPGQQASLIPPKELQGQWKLPHLLNWMDEKAAPTAFSPTLPPLLLHSRPVRSKVLHRLTYEAANTGDDSPARKTLKVELVLPRALKDSEDMSDPSEPVFHSKCWSGQKVDLDVMMPDRPADIRFSILDSVLLPADQWPAILEEHISNLRAFLLYQDRDASQPETPLTLVHEGVAYVLHSSSTVRQNVETTQSESPTVRLVTENSLDLEGDQKSASCQVICEDIQSTTDWKVFLSHCDSMSTSVPAQTPRRPPTAELL
ncbi:hypothetical protein C8R47DRAFT_1106099 [Mycena vitilis]|nr:hypothetical protein C8R47DRAFT_1106099 [Mycena vitilis]